METLRLRKIQQPAQVERLLEAFVTRGSLLPKDCYQIRDSSGLSAQLQRVLAREAKTGRIWGCWANSSRAWLFTCEMSLSSSRERAAPVLQVSCYNELGELEETGTWVAGPHGEWHRCGE
jgi:hypothetical protein